MQKPYYSETECLVTFLKTKSVTSLEVLLPFILPVGGYDWCTKVFHAEHHRGVAVGNDRDDTVRLVPRTFAGLRRYVGRHESGAAKTKKLEC